MGFLRQRLEINNQTTYTLRDKEFLNLMGIDIDSINHNKLGELTYFVALKHLSETMSKLPLHKYLSTDKGKQRTDDMKLYNILNLEPNPYYTASTLWGSAELSRNHYGNAYIYVESYGGKIKHLWLLPSHQMKVMIDERGHIGKKNSIWYIWSDPKTKKSYTFSKDEIIHLKSSMSLDGLTGLAVRDILRLQIETAQHGQNYLYKLYKSNMFGGKVLLHYADELDKSAEEYIAEKLEHYSKNVGSGKFLPLPLGFQAQVLDMKLSDAEFTDLNKLNALQIASAFGIKPNILNNYENSSYSNSESQQVDFYINSLLPILRQYEQELTIKLLTSKEKMSGNYLEFNPNIIFRTDFKTQVEALAKAVNNFSMTPNEARNKLGLPWIEGGDDLIGNGNYIRLDQVGNQWVKGGVIN